MPEYRESRYGPTTEGRKGPVAQVLRCNECWALVEDDDTEGHDQWHRKLDHWISRAAAIEDSVYGVAR